MPGNPSSRSAWLRRGRLALGWGAGLALAAVLLLVATLPDTARLARENPTETAFTRLTVERQRAAGRDAKAPTIRWVPLSGISRHVQRAVVTSEDHGFFLHDGFEWAEIRDSWERNLKEGRIARGGSTLTMQLAKNLYLSPSKNPLRKLREALITVKLERDLSKERILEIYLNVIEWGDGIHGIEAAARRYYGKSASEITEDEAAWLAACIPNPRRSNPARVTPGLRARHDRILASMRRYRVEGID